VPIDFTTTTASPERVDADLLAVPVYADRELGPGGEAVDDALDIDLPTFMKEAGFTGKLGQTRWVPSGDGIAADSVVIVGLGSPDEVSAGVLRRAAAAVARKARKAGSVATTLVSAGNDVTADARAVAEGLILGSYQFLTYKGDGEDSELTEVISIGPGGKRVLAAFDRGGVVADATCWARDMVNEPAGSLGPREFVAAARKQLAGAGVRVTVLEEAQIRKQKLGGLLGVNAGSDEPPRFLKVSYSPTSPRGSLAFVGKGVTFDSGGLSLKPAKAMEQMKTDMGGAAAVVGAMSALRDAGVRTKVTAYVPLTENMPNGRATRPGDVLTIRNGKTVEVLNTDAEGRLILADALSLAVEDGPDAIVDLATLTGACLVALGEKIAGLMGNNDSLVEQVEEAAGAAGEPVWHLPLPEDYRSQLDSEIADVQNIGGQWAGSLTAGLFLEEFVDDVPWAHLDIAGPARADKDDGELTRGGTGYGVRTLVELASSFRRPVRNG